MAVFLSICFMANLRKAPDPWGHLRVCFKVTCKRNMNSPGIDTQSWESFVLSHRYTNHNPNQSFSKNIEELTGFVKLHHIF
ncbi:hypothetical protein EB796_002461 [Bugula neritina]|uniref:Uncharacterized protein n=1 Tax=Bugula neritina TaxID=10212 RepID=A0A7J7KM52_BUGNE|nr:hypothetical protein EB796_002461 [Bugula neritina]